MSLLFASFFQSGAAEDQKFLGRDQKKMTVTLNAFFCASAPLTRGGGKKKIFLNLSDRTFSLKRARI
jgi:hypothetical protein